MVWNSKSQFIPIYTKVFNLVLAVGVDGSLVFI